MVCDSFAMLIPCGRGEGGLSNIGYTGMYCHIGSQFLSLMYSFRPGILRLGITLWQIPGYHLEIAKVSQGNGE